VELVVNGQRETLVQEMSLADFVASKGFKRAVVVVERNQKIVANSDWDTTVLQDGDSLEIVSFVGGG
jgi:thiamine biosynthesis protein ThiS